MGMPASELASRMSYTEFMEHLADYHIEPWDAVRGDFQAAQIVCTLANLHRAKGRAPYTVNDCLMRFDDNDADKQQRQTPDQVVRHLERFFDRYETIQNEN